MVKASLGLWVPPKSKPPEDLRQPQPVGTAPDAHPSVVLPRAKFRGIFWVLPPPSNILGVLLRAIYNHVKFISSQLLLSGGSIQGILLMS